MQNQAFYRPGIFGNFFFGGGEFCVFKTGIPGGPGRVRADGAAYDSSRFGFGARLPNWAKSANWATLAAVCAAKFGFGAPGFEQLFTALH